MPGLHIYSRCHPGQADFPTPLCEVWERLAPKELSSETWTPRHRRITHSALAEGEPRGLGLWGESV